MGTAKKCYICLATAEGDARVCPNCGAKLGARTRSGVAAKPGSPFLKLFLAAAAFAAIGVLASRSHTESAPPAEEAPVVISGVGNLKDETIQKIKEKGAGDLSSIGVTDIGYTGDDLALYVDQRFTSLSDEQQVKLLTLIAAEWKKALGRDSTGVKILQHGTQNLLAELQV